MYDNTFPMRDKDVKRILKGGTYEEREQLGYLCLRFLEKDVVSHVKLPTWESDELIQDVMLVVWDKQHKANYLNIKSDCSFGSYLCQMYKQKYHLKRDTENGNEKNVEALYRNLKKISMEKEIPLIRENYYLFARLTGLSITRIASVTENHITIFSNDKFVDSREQIIENYS